MKTLLLYILCMAAETTASGPLTEKPHHHPIYRYSCNEDLSVTFKGVNGVVKYFPVSPTENPSQGVGCNIGEIPNHLGSFSISKECLYPSSDNSHDRLVYVSVFDNTENEATPKPTQSPTPQPTQHPVLGFHIFKLTCKAIPSDGVMRYALAETGVKEYEQMHELYNEVKDVDMKFKEGKGLDYPDVSEVYIGDMFYMYLIYMGTQSYTIEPVKCSASKGTFRLTDAVDLWDNVQTGNTPKCITQVAKDYQIMNAFERNTSKVVLAQLHGFRLASELTGDPAGDDVTISCQVKICINCADSCTIAQVSRRKRRYVDEKASLHTVNRTIKIKDKAPSSNDGGTHSVRRTMVTVLALLALVIHAIL